MKYGDIPVMKYNKRIGMWCVWSSPRDVSLFNGFYSAVLHRLRLKQGKEFV